MTVIGHLIKDHLPTLPNSTLVQSQWKGISELRENVMAKRHILATEYHDQYTHILPALSVGDLVLIQNQTGIKLRSMLGEDRVHYRNATKQKIPHQS